MPRYFTKEHEWIEVEGDTATVGITEHAQHQLGDVVFVEVPAPGKHLEQGREAAVVESVKAASDVYAPLSGEVVAVNAAAVDDPATVGTDPQGAGWLYRLRLDAPSEMEGLMDEAAYAALPK